MDTTPNPWTWTLGFATALLLGGCVGDLADDDWFGDDDALEDDDVADDDDAGEPDQDDDSAGDDDAGDDDTAAIDDSTCDEGATAATAITFHLTDTFFTPLDGAEWTIHDLDPFDGTIDPTVVASGTAPASGQVTVSLDCAHGWMVLETTHPGTVTLHNYFRVYTVPYWPVMAPSSAVATGVGVLLDSPGGGVLGVYKPGPSGQPDCQGVDAFHLDGGPDLVPTAAANDIGLWVYAGALGNELADVWNVDAEVPGHGTVATLEYVDESQTQTTVLNAPIWSWDASPDPDGARHVTTVYVLD